MVTMLSYFHLVLLLFLVRIQSVRISLSETQKSLTYAPYVGCVGFILTRKLRKSGGCRKKPSMSSLRNKGIGLSSLIISTAGTLEGFFMGGIVSD